MRKLFIHMISMHIIISHINVPFINILKIFFISNISLSMTIKNIFQFIAMLSNVTFISTIMAHKHKF